MRKHIDCDVTGFTQDFSVCMDPQRPGAPDRNAPGPITEYALKFQMVTAVGSREDPEKVHAVQVVGTAEIEDLVSIHGVRTEFETAAFIAGIHDDSKQCAGIDLLIVTAPDLHTDHRAGHDHVDRLGDIGQLSQADAVEDRLKMRAVSPLADGRIKPDPGADIEEPCL